MSGILGLDIGGANLKAAHSAGRATSVAFPLWKQPHQLTDALRDIRAAFPTFDQVAITMTGELCDCFANKREGVTAILSAAVAAFPSKRLRVWRTDGRFTDTINARETPLKTGAANWHALATFAARYVGSEPAMLIDMGSTTTDIIPIIDGKPAPRGWTDAERLRTRELLYLGMTRTPVCALLGTEGCAELFATIRDVHLLTGRAPEDGADCDTADGRPATKEFAHVRLARMVGADTESMGYAAALLLANRLTERVREALVDAILHVRDNMPQQPCRYIVAGQGDLLVGEFGMRGVFLRHVSETVEVLPEAKSNGFLAVALRNELGEEISRAACAYAVAILALETSQNETPA